MKRIAILGLLLVLVLAFASMGVGLGWPKPPKGHELHVGYPTIQAAIDAASPGDTIIVHEGTYDGNIHIDKSLTIIGDPGDGDPGPGVNAPVIDGGGSVTTGASSGFFIENGVSNVTIAGFEIKGFISTGTGEGDGVQAWVASTNHITVRDNYFHDLSWNAVLVGNDGALGDHTNWTISNNIVEDYGGYGLELTNASDSTIENNIVTADNSWTGILVVARRNESNITIKNNNITGTLDTIANGGRAGIYVLGWGFETPGLTFDGVSITGNTISITSPENLAYINVNEVVDAHVLNVAVHNNNLADADAAGYGLKNNAATLIDATKNWWGDRSGPYNLTSNPDGTGSPVSNNVDFAPWLRSPVKKWPPIPSWYKPWPLPHHKTWSPPPHWPMP